MSSSASLISLKAELLKKQEEFQTAVAKRKHDYVKGRSDIPKLSRKVTYWSKRNRGVEARSKKDEVENKEEENLLEKSRNVLQSKSRLYDELADTRCLPDDNVNEQYLVNFEQKTVDAVLARKRREEKQAQLDENNKDKGPKDWVDYLDAQGREKTCLKEDLEKCMEREAITLKLREQERNYNANLHKKWTQEEMEAAHQPTHYSSVLYDERRTHGVGFFKFSRDETERQEQLKQLNNMRQQTKEEQMRLAKLRIKHHEMVLKRIEKVKRRRLVRLGGVDITIPELNPSIYKLAYPEQYKEKSPTPEPEAPCNANAPVREWDVGKPDTVDDEAYLAKERERREAEFAPPVVYQERTYQERTYQERKRSAENNNEDGEENYSAGDTSTNTRKKKKKKNRGKRGNKKQLQAHIEARLKAARVQSDTQNVTDVGSIPLPDDQQHVPTPEQPRTYKPPDATAGGHYSDVGTVQPPYVPAVHHPYTGDIPQQYDDTSYQSYEYVSHQPYGSSMHSHAAGTAPLYNSLTSNCGLNRHTQCSDHQLYNAAYSSYPDDNGNTQSSSSAVPPTNTVANPQVPSRSESMHTSPSQSVMTPSNYKDSNDSSPTLQSEVDATVGAPQPSHYSAAPCKPAAPALKAVYERVHAHQVPHSLPAPPSTCNVPHYPSQENALGSSQDNKESAWSMQYVKPLFKNKPPS